MLRALISIFKTDNPLGDMGTDFRRMLKLTYEMTVTASQVFFEGRATPEERTHIYESDVQVNKLQRKIRKQVVRHLSLAGNTTSLPYCLALVSLVKDVERIGDYAKNVSELVEIHSGPLPDDETVAELREIRRGVVAAFEATSDVFATSDREHAEQLIHQGRDMAKRCDALVTRIASSDYESSTTVATVLATRFYKRIGGHVLNVLSSVVMPLHKLDYYDEDAIPFGRSDDGSDD